MHPVCPYYFYGLSPHYGLSLCHSHKDTVLSSVQPQEIAKKLDKVVLFIFRNVIETTVFSAHRLRNLDIINNTTRVAGSFKEAAKTVFSARGLRSFKNSYHECKENLDISNNTTRVAGSFKEAIKTVFSTNTQDKLIRAYGDFQIHAQLRHEVAFERWYCHYQVMPRKLDRILPRIWAVAYAVESVIRSALIMLTILVNTCINIAKSKENHEALNRQLHSFFYSVFAVFDPQKSRDAFKESVIQQKWRDKLIVH